MIELAPDNALARRGRGSAEFSAKHYRAALDDLTEAIKLDPEDALAYRLRSQAYAALHEDPLATTDDAMWQRLARKRR